MGVNIIVIKSDNKAKANLDLESRSQDLAAFVYNKIPFINYVTKIGNLNIYKSMSRGHTASGDEDDVT